jgi:hypothetical protein
MHARVESAMSRSVVTLPLFRGPRAAPRGSGAAVLLLSLLVSGAAAAAPRSTVDPCTPAAEQPSAAPSSRALSERVRCLEHEGRLLEAVPLLHRLAASPEATVRERAYLHLYRLGQEVALPPEGEAGALEPAPGCLRSLWADRYLWAERQGGRRVQGSAALLFATVPEELTPLETPGEPAEGAGQEVLLGAGSGDEAAAAPVETGRPEDRVSDTGGALDLLVSSLEEPGEGAQARGEDVVCSVVVADACTGRVAVVCEDRAGLPLPEEDQLLPFPLPTERLEVKEFQLP